MTVFWLKRGELRRGSSLGRDVVRWLLNLFGYTEPPTPVEHDAQFLEHCRKFGVNVFPQSKPIDALEIKPSGKLVPVQIVVDAYGNEIIVECPAKAVVEVPRAPEPPVPPKPPRAPRKPRARKGKRK